MFDRRALRTLSGLIVFLTALALASNLRAVPPTSGHPAGETPDPQAPKIAPASDEGKQRIGSIRVPDGFQVELFAAEPLLANPVAFTIDDQGKFYVCETFRQSQGVEDNRHHGVWLNDDLAAQTVEDRLAYYQKHLKEDINKYTLHDDRLRLLEDTNGDGQADRSTVFAEHFNGILDGTGAGVLVHNASVYYTCIPHLWKLQDTDGDGQADVRKSLHYGYGVRVAFRGHDMHGLCVGPDGRIYYSIGDRGYHITTDGKTFHNPESGAVFRCEPDGSNLEIVATGLRNPQELAFDDFGNLFTGDNNSDSGDKARWVHIVEGSDSGWRMSYQYLKDRGPWNREQLWHPYHPGQAAYIVPPLANFADGPSGLAYYPGTGLPDKYAGHFFLCDFRGGPANSGIRTFTNRPKGSTFEMVDAEEFVWNVLATDVEFGPDGGVYVSDWVDGWNGLGKGRIYRVANASSMGEKSHEVQSLLAGKLSGHSLDELKTLLGHADRRVRQSAQFELVNRKARTELAAVATANDPLLARVHAVWGLGMLGRYGDAQSDAVLASLLNSENEEVVAQALSVLNERANPELFEVFVTKLKSQSPRVKYFAAQALGKLNAPRAVPALLAVLEQNNDVDPVLRHAAVMGLTGSADPATLMKHADHLVPSVRLGLLLALRRQGSPEVSYFLNDVDPRLVLEAARAIHDLPIPESLPQLAQLVNRPLTDDALARRVLNANYRLGGTESAQRLAALAGQSEAAESVRLEALAMLAAWQEPDGRDRVLGMWRPLAARDPQVAQQALEPVLPQILTGPDAVRKAGAQAAAALGIKQVIPTLQELALDATRSGEVRSSALSALAALKDPKLGDHLKKLVDDDDATVRVVSLDLLAQRGADVALPLLELRTTSDSLIERQGAFATLGKLGAAAEPAMASALDNLLSGKVPADTRLDVLEAAAELDLPTLKQKLTSYAASKPADDPLAPYRETLAGGDAARGRDIFFHRASVSCIRCHTTEGAGGQVGPKLTHVSKDKTREYLLESILLPSKSIAKGFETAVIVTDSGLIHTGIVKQENDENILLLTATGQTITVAKDEVEERFAGKSSMPEDLVKQLTKRDLRDLVEYLSTLK